MKGDFSRDSFDPTKHYSNVLMQQGRVQLDADWNEQQRIHRHRAETESKDVVGRNGAPLRDAGFQITVQSGNRLAIGKGRYYVDGLLCENEVDIAYAAQPDLPNASDVVGLLTGAATTFGVVYLDVWRRHVTAFDDPLIREVALGGPDTTTRVKTVWQVKVLPVRAPATGIVSCGDTLSEWDDLIKSSTGTLSARSQPAQSATTPCLLPPMTGYRRLENQLYRVEIHKAGALGAATFKWSRDNGAVVTALEAVNGRDLTVHDLGRDDVLGFSGGQWIEIVDDGQELRGQPGQLVQIDAVNPATRVITLRSAPPSIDPARRTKVRRWDSVGELAVAVPATNNGWIALEDGVEVKFESGTYATGDYWTIPARTATGNVEWPFTAPRPPAGIIHHFSRLAILTLAGNALSAQDCRRIFSPLAEAAPALHVTGINWINDDVLPQGLDQLNRNGLQIFLDGVPVQPPPASVAAVLVVTMEAPVLVSANPSDPIARTQGSVILNGDIAFPSPNTLQWKPAQGGAELTQLARLFGNQLIPRVRLRVSLKGSAVWRDQGAQRLYLDGQALGQPGFRADGVTPRIDLLLPSGGNERASNFESWFYLQLQIPEPNLASLDLDPLVVVAGNPVTGTILLDQPAPAGGATVTLSSSSPTIASVPATIVVPAGQTRATLTVTTTVPPNTADIVVAAVFRGVTRTATLRVQVVSVAISPAEVTLFASRAQQFTASVAGTTNTAVTWSVQQAGGGTVNASGLYVAPATLGNFNVVATSQADPNRRATALVHVVAKPKDKEKEKEKEKEKDLKEKERKELAKEKDLVKEREEPFRPVGGPLIREESFIVNEDLAEGRTFIRPEERPDVGDIKPQDSTPEEPPDAGTGKPKKSERRPKPRRRRRGKKADRDA
jgi:hypothetical protein